MRVLILLAPLLITASSHAQTINVDDSAKFTNSIIYLTSSSGIPFVTAKYARIVEGSAFVPEVLTPAQIFLKGNAKVINNVPARMNILDKDLNYFDERLNKEMVADNNISEVRFKDAATSQIRIYTKSIPGCANASQGWHEVLETGKLSLYREIVKTIVETKQYSSATTEQTILTKYNYWVTTGNACRPVRKIADLIELIQKSDPGFSASLPQKKRSEKNEEDWIEVVRLYNATH